MDNILLIVEDCLRYDYSRTHMPYLNSLRPYVYGQYYANSFCSDPNYATMMTGLPVHLHGVLSQSCDVDQGATEYIFKLPQTKSLPEIMKEREYHTAYCGWKSAVLGAAAGFEVDWSYSDEDERPAQYQRLRELIDITPEPWFIMFRGFWCHSPWPAGYGDAVRRTDVELFKIIRERLADTFVIVTADHGEVLVEDGTLGGHLTCLNHSGGLYERLVHVPLMVMGPAWLKDATSVRGVLNHQDLFYALAQGSVYPQGTRQFLTFFGLGLHEYKVWQFKGAFDGRFKLVICQPMGQDSAAPLFEAYDTFMEGDQQNLITQMRVFGPVNRMASLLREVDASADETDETVVERLKGLGYWNG